MDDTAMNNLDRMLGDAEDALRDAQGRLGEAATALDRLEKGQRERASRDLVVTGAHTLLIEAKRAAAGGDIGHVVRALDALLDAALTPAHGADLRADLWSARCL